VKLTSAVDPQDLAGDEVTHGANEQGGRAGGFIDQGHTLQRAALY